MHAPSFEGFACKQIALIRLHPIYGPGFTALELNLDTDNGKRVAQQLFIDIGRFWAGQAVEYLALYRRNW